jgi:OmpA-OmpF porin, OOP family
VRNNASFFKDSAGVRSSAMNSRGARAGSAFVVVCLTFGMGGVALAQSEPPYDPAVDVQLFEPAAGPKSYFSVDDASTAGDKQVAVDFMVTFLSNPFTIYNVADDEETIEGERTRVVENEVAGAVTAAYGLKDKYQIGIALPLVFAMQGEGLDPATATAAMESLQITGLGDLRAELKTKLWQSGGMRLAGAVGATLPSSFGSGGNEYLGDNLPSFRARGAWNFTAPDGKLSFGANLGVILRKPRTIYASEVGQQLTFGAAAAYRVTDRFSVVAETFGRTGLGAFDIDASPIEAGGGLRIAATKAFQVVLGGSTGLVQGIGSPDLRVFASIGYAPDTRDSDGDGVPNNKDGCTLVPEDDDGFQDGDGCPDDDNDGDRRADGEDKCVSEAEDIDGFDDDDGCPDLDNDGDGIADLDDRFCPMDKEDGQAPQPKDGCPFDKRDTDADSVYDHNDACYEQGEDLDGFEDFDGCPEADNDKDGVADDDDRCSLCPEDKDGVEDGDGCPEMDADKDGIADEKDRCNGELEVINGVDDWDGCPDEGGAEVASLDGDRLTFRAPVGFDKKGLTKAGTVLLDQAALIMLQHPEVSTWIVAVSAKKDAKKRGEWVLRHLVSRGVSLDRLQIATTTGDDAVGMVVQERAEVEEGAAPACPAGMEVQPRQAPAGSAPAAQPAPAGDVELE